MPKVIWIGSRYRRNDGSYRQRGTGFVTKNPPKVIVRRGQRNIIIVKNGKNYLGSELPKHNFYGFDPKPLKGQKIIFQKRVRSAKERRAMFGRMKGGR